VNAADMDPRLTLDPDTRDTSKTRVLFDHVRIGEIRAEYVGADVAKLEYFAWRSGRLIYGPAATLERAAQALADYNTRPEN
jgi:hypothetical protein